MCREFRFWVPPGCPAALSNKAAPAARAKKCGGFFQKFWRGFAGRAYSWIVEHPTKRNRPAARSRRHPLWPPALLFLDVDGVLNTTGSQIRGGMTNLCPAAVRAMKELLSAAAFDVVISSSWRTDRLPLLRATLKKHGLRDLDARIIGCTPSLPAGEGAARGDEIDLWLHQNSYAGRLAILDDEPSIPHLQPWWIAVDMQAGLTSPLALAASELLMRGPSYCAGA